MKKKLITCGIIVALLLGGTITAYAANCTVYSAHRFDRHTVIGGYVQPGSHQYVYGSINGETIISTCNTVTYFDKCVYSCACGETYLGGGVHAHQVRVSHSSCNLK